MKDTAKQERRHQNGQPDTVVAERLKSALLQEANHPFHGKECRKPCGEAAEQHGTRAVIVEKKLVVLEELVAGGGCQGHHAEQETEFDRGNHIESAKQSAHNGHQTAAGPRPHGNTLQDTDNDGNAGSDLVQREAGVAAARGGISFEPCHGQDGDPANEPCGDRRPEPGEESVDPLFKEQACQGRRNESKDNIAQQNHPLGVFTHQAFRHAAGFGKVDAQHRKDGPRLDDDGEGFGRFIVGDAQRTLREEDMTRAADGEIFSDPLNEADNECLQPVHGKSRDVPPIPREGNYADD